MSRKVVIFEEPTVNFVHHPVVSFRRVLLYRSS